MAERTKTLFINTGGNSDALRGKNCNQYMFHVESQNSMYVKTCGRSLLAQRAGQGQEVVLAHRRLRLRPRPAAGRQALHGSATAAQFAADKLVPTDATDFSPLLLEIRNAKPDLVISNLAGNQITNFLKQYSEFGLHVPGGGLRLRHRASPGAPARATSSAPGRWSGTT